MLLVIITALVAVCGADKLDKTYLPPLSAKTAGGSAGFLQAPYSRSLEQVPVSQGLPAGGFANEFQGVVVDAANPGSRASGVEQTGLGGPRSSYGSSDSKVGDAAFKTNGFGSSGNIASTRIAPGFNAFGSYSEDGKAGQAGEGSIRLAPGFNAAGADGSDHGSNTLKFNNEIGLDKYNYGYETENGIAVGQNGVASGGVKAEGGYSYKGNDGKLYKVTYTADKNGYKPEGSHLPTPPPIPQEILVSLEKNAEEEAAGVVDDGSYDAQKYNDEGDYSNGNKDVKHNAQPSAGNKPGGSFTKPGSGATGYYSSQGSQFGSGGFGTSGPSGNGQFGQSQIGFGSQQFTSQFGSQSAGAHGQGSKLDSKTKTESRFGAGYYNAQRYSGGNTAFSSAVTSGSGSASAFAQSGGISNDDYQRPPSANIKYQGSDSSGGSSLNTPSVATASSFVTDSPFESGSQASANSQPGVSTSFASVQGSSGEAFGSSFDEGLKNQYGSNLPSSAIASASVSPKPSSGFGTQTKQQFGTYQSSQPGYSSFPTKQGQGAFGSNFSGSKYQTGSTAKPGQVSISSGPSQFESLSSGIKPTQPSASSFSIQGPTNIPETESSNFGSYNSQSSYNLGSQNSVAQAKPTGAFASTTQKPSFNQPQGPDHSYFYKQPSKPFATPVSPISSKFPSSFPQVSKNSNAPVSPTTASQTTLSNYNGVTQAAISSFPSGSPTASTPFGSQSSQFGSKPSQFNQQSTQTSKPFVQSQTQPDQSSNFGQSTVSSSVSPTQEYEGTIYEYNKPPETLPTPSPAPIKPVSASGSQFGQKPFGSSLTSGSKFPQSQFGSSSGSQFGQKPFGSSQSAFGQKPFGSSLTSGSKFQQGQFGSSTGSQFGQKPFGTSQGAGSTFPQNQFGSSSEFGQKPQTEGSSFTLGSQSSQQQTQFGSSTGSQFGQKPQTSQSFTTQKEQTTQFNQKPFGSSQTGSSFQQTQSQFGQKPGTIFSSGAVSEGQTVETSQFPIESQSGGSSFQQNQFGSSSGSQTDQKPQNTQGTTFSSTTTTTQKEQTTQFGQKPFSTTTTGASLQQNQFSSASGSQFGQKPFGNSQTGSYQQSQFGNTGSTFGQKPQSIQGSSFTTGTQTSQSQFGQKPFGSSQTGSTLQQTQYESQFQQKPSTVQGSSFTSNTVSKGQVVQTSQFPLKPQTGGSAFQPNQFGTSVGSQFSQKPQTTQGSSFTSTTTTNQKGQVSQFGQKPFGSSQTGSTVQQSQFSTSGTQFGKRPETTQGTGFYPGAVSGGQAIQTTQFALKPQTGGSVSQQNQFGTFPESQFNQKPQSTQGTSLTSTTTSTQKEQTAQFGQKPFGSTQYAGIGSQQNQFGSSTGSQFGQKPFGSSQTGSYFQQSQFGTSGSTFGQKPQKAQGSSFTTGTQSQFGQKPFGSSQLGSTFQQNQYGSQFGQKPSTVQGSSLTSNTVSKGQAVQTSQFPLKPQSVGTSFQQNQFGSSTGSQFGQKPQTTQGSSFTTTSTTNQKEQSSQFGQTSFGSSQIGSNFQETQFGTSGSQFGQKPQSQDSKFQQNQIVSTTESQFVLKPQYSQEQISQFGQKPLGSSQATDSEESVFSTSGSQFGQKPETTQGSTFTTTTTTTQKEQTSQYGQKPFGSAQNIGSNFQQSQISSSGQKPFGSSQNTGSGYEQTQFATASGTQFGQEPESIKGSVLNSNQVQGQTAQSQFGQKPFGSQNTGSSFEQNQFGSISGSQLSQSQTTVHKEQTIQGSQFGQKPFGSSQTGSNYQQSQFVTTGSQFGQKPQSGFSSSTSTQGQSIQSQFPQKPFGSNFQQNQFGSSTESQSGSSSTTEYKGQTVQTTQLGQKPFGSQTTGSSFQQGQVGSVFSSQSPVTTSKPQFGNKPFGSTQGSFQQTQFGSTSQSIGLKPQANNDQNTGSVFGTQFGSQSQKPFGTTQTTFQQNQFGSSSQFGQKPQLGQANAFASSSSSSFPQFGTQPKPFGDSQSNKDSKFSIGSQTQKPFGTQSQTFQQSQYTQSSESSQTSFGGQVPQSQFGSNQQNPSENVNESGFQTQFGQSLDQKTQENIKGTDVSSQSSSSSVGFGSKPTGTSGSYGSYSYQKPQSTFGTNFGTNSGSQTGQNVRPTQNSAFASASSLPFGVSTTESSNFKESQTTLSQFGAQPTINTIGNNYASTSRPQFGVEPVSSTTVSSVQPTQSSLPFSGQTYKPFGNAFGVQSTQSSSQVTSQTSKPQFGQAFKPVGSTFAPGFQTTSQNGGVQISSDDLQSLQKGELFGGPRDPPKFDDKTGYHY